MAETTVFRARKIITMDPNLPVATHVAVRDGRILAVGGPDCAEGWGGGRADDSLAHAVLLPGFIEGHSHLQAGALWRFCYVGFHDRRDPEGRLWPGAPDAEAVIARLREFGANLPAGEPLIAWGLDPIFLKGERLNRTHLDAASTERPIVILHQSLHLVTTNTAALDVAGFGPGTNIEGVMMEGGRPNGELRELGAMFPLFRRLGFDLRRLSRGPEALTMFAEAARRVGVTTATDLFSTVEEEEVEELLAFFGRPDIPLRLVPSLASVGAKPEEIVAKALRLRARATDKLRFGAIKVMTDGSIQGFTGRLKWPGYLGGQPNGLWNTAPEELFALVEACHAAGLQMNLHANGDEASEVTIDALAAAIGRHPPRDHRHIIQHGQMIGADQFRRMKALGLCANLFANHLFYYGDQHAAVTIGEDRARRMDACRACLDEGVPLAIHSDAPVTPMGPLTVAWCAANRITGSARVLGPEQRISVTEALRAVTLGVAHTMHLDRDLGSIETGKIADFAALGEDPTAVPPEDLRDVPVLGTVFAGTPRLN